MQNNRFTIKVMTRSEIDIAVDWAAAEGWNPGLNDADCFHAADPSGFLVGLVDSEPVATISAVKYGNSFGFIGFYIVRPDCRGKGYGLQIWNAAMAYLAGRSIGLDGVVSQQDNYAKSGFALAYRNIRYRGTGGGAAADDPRIAPLSCFPLANVLAYDRPFFPDRRDSFLKCWLVQPQSTALGIRDQNGQLAGYGVVRACRSGHKIGPLFADTPQLAERLFLALRAGTPAEAPIFLDVPDTNLAAIALAQRHGMTPVFETARMYAGTPPKLPLSRLFGVTTFELG
ncbi:MAG: GNAT family N-acetyltransferase [Patescibacteria group bacterium]|nr:GNAT family N-acetyltransferase [Patescibacteria group bacterium]